MARFAGKNFRFRRKMSVTKIIKMVVATVIALYAGSEIIDALALALNGTSGIFSTAFQLLGFNAAANVLDGTVTTTGLLSLIGLVGALAIINQVVEMY